MCVLSGEYLLVHTIRNRLKKKPVEFTKFKLFRAILTKNCPERTIINKSRSSMAFQNRYHVPKYQLLPRVPYEQHKEN